MNSTFEIRSPAIEPGVIYIQPFNPIGAHDAISFNEIIKTLKVTDTPITNRFVKFLEKWKKGTNKKP